MKKIILLLVLLAAACAGNYDSLLNRSNREPNRPFDPNQECSEGVRVCDVWGASRIPGKQSYYNCRCVLVR